MENNLQIEFNQDCEFYRVTCPEWYYITNYTLDKDIREFKCSPILYFSSIMFTPEEINEQYHLITEEEKQNYTTSFYIALKQKGPLKIIDYGSN